jgi:hypothetical protein
MKEQQIFSTINGNSLMSKEYEPLKFTIDKILPHGIFVFAGSPKVGKSWLTQKPNSHHRLFCWHSTDIYIHE